VRRLLPTPVDPVDPAEVYGDLPSASGRPAVRVNMVASADGATAIDGRAKALSGEPDRRLFHLMRSLAEVILVGAETVRRERYRPAAVPIAVVSRLCAFDWSSPFFTEATCRPIVFTVAIAPDDALGRTRDVADVVVVGETDVDVAAAVSELGDRGFSHVLCEGGPTLNGYLAGAGVLDELCLSISPQLVGGRAKRALSSMSPVPSIPLELVSLCEEDGNLFCRYRPA